MPRTSHASLHALHRLLWRCWLSLTCRVLLTGSPLQQLLPAWLCHLAAAKHFVCCSSTRSLFGNVFCLWSLLHVELMFSWAPSVCLLYCLPLDACSVLHCRQYSWDAWCATRAPCVDMSCGCIATVLALMYLALSRPSLGQYKPMCLTLATCCLLCVPRYPVAFVGSTPALRTCLCRCMLPLPCLLQPQQLLSNDPVLWLIARP